MDLHPLASREVLLPVGISLAMVGIFLRGFARGIRRSAALEQQHRLHHRKLGEPDTVGKKSSWLDRHLGRIANTAAIVGVAITILSFFRT